MTQHYGCLKGTAMATATHRHKKRGTLYTLIGYGKMQAEHWHTAGAVTAALVDAIPLVSVDMDEVAVYQSIDDGQIWVRPREEFEDGRFEVLGGNTTGIAPEDADMHSDFRRRGEE
jgi:hypothetical protein